MSRIGKKPILIPEGTSVSVNGNIINVKGKFGELNQEFKAVRILQNGNHLVIERLDDSKSSRSFHGTYRSLIYNMVEGVSKGFEKKLELVGVGYRASHQGQKLDLSLGFSHNIVLDLPKEIKLETVTEKGKNLLIKMVSFDKQLLGMIAAKIRSFRKPEPYKGKGIKFEGEVLRRKAGKTA